MAMDHLKPVQWNDSFSVGVKLIDDEHKLLLVIFEELVITLRTQQPKAVAKRAIEDLTGYVTYHFAHEEELMKAFHYPDFDAHQKEHDKLTARLMEIDQNLERKKANITDVIDTIKLLINHHFMNTDAKMGQYLRNKIPGNYQPFAFSLDSNANIDH
ncbi:MAG: bacteriohemerythrin [Rhodospirillaceae bacterium]